MRRVRRSWLIALAIAAVVVAGAATSALTGGDPPRASTTIRTNPDAPCASSWRALVAALDVIHVAVPTGPADDYHRRVAKAQRLSDSVEYRKLDAGCTARIGVPAWAALRAYTEAGRGWSSGPAPARAARLWREARAAVKEADRGLRWALTTSD
jgi:hypothetical protein